MRSACRPATHNASKCMPALVSGSMTVTAALPVSGSNGVSRSTSRRRASALPQAHAAGDRVQRAELGERIMKLRERLMLDAVERALAGPADACAASMEALGPFARRSRRNSRAQQYIQLRAPQAAVARTAARRPSVRARTSPSGRAARSRKLTVGERAPVALGFAADEKGERSNRPAAVAGRSPAASSMISNAASTSGYDASGAGAAITTGIEPASPPVRRCPGANTSSKTRRTSSRRAWTSFKMTPTSPLPASTCARAHRAASSSSELASVAAYGDSAARRGALGILHSSNRSALLAPPLDQARHGGRRSHRSPRARSVPRGVKRASSGPLRQLRLVDRLQRATATCKLAAPLKQRPRLPQRRTRPAARSESGSRAGAASCEPPAAPRWRG